MIYYLVANNGNFDHFCHLQKTLVLTPFAGRGGAITMMGLNRRTQTSWFGHQCLSVLFVLITRLVLAAANDWNADTGPLGPDPENPESSCFVHCTSYNPDLPTGCQRKAPRGLNGRGTPLWFYKGWPSLDLGAMVAKVLLRDILGYRNITLMWGAWKGGLVTNRRSRALCHSDL